MKVAMINVYFYPELVGGAEWYVYNISRELVKRGHEVHVFSSARSNEAEEQHPSFIEGIRIHRIPLALNLSHKLKLWRALDEAIVAEDPDIVHSFDHAQIHSYLAMRASSVLACPFLLTVFDVHSLVPRPWYKRIPMNVIELVAARTVLAKADMILVRAPSLVPFLVKMGAPQERIAITPSGIRPEALLQADGSHFLIKYHIESHPIVLYLGRLHPSKGLEDLVRAAPSVLKEHPTTRIVLVGPDWSNYGKRISEIAQKLGIGQNIVMTGAIYEFSEKMSAYASCDVFVLPSGYEGTSQSIFEAMAQGRPIVATKSGGIPFQVENGKEGILVEFGDAQGLALAIKRLLTDREIANELGSNAREKVKQFTYPLLASKIEEIYSALLEQRTTNQD